MDCCKNMATAIALVGHDYHNFNSDFKLTHIVSLFENGSRPVLIITNDKGNRIGDPYICSLDSVFDDLMYVIASNILGWSKEDIHNKDKSTDLQINIMRLCKNSILRFNQSTYHKYSNFTRLKLHTELGK